MENVFFKNKSEAGESGDYQNNIGVQPGEHTELEPLSNDPEDAKGRVKIKKFESVEFSTPTRFFFFLIFFNPSLSGITSERRAMNI